MWIRTRPGKGPRGDVCGVESRTAGSPFLENELYNQDAGNTFSGGLPETLGLLNRIVRVGVRNAKWAFLDMTGYYRRASLPSLITDINWHRDFLDEDIFGN